MMANKPWKLTLFLIFLLLGCTPASCPDCYVVVPTSDNTPPIVGMDIYDPDTPISISQTSQAKTIIAVSDVVSVLAYAADENGGVKTVKIWATYTYYKPGQIPEPDEALAPVTQYESSARVGEQTPKRPTAKYDFDLKKELGSWSRLKVDIWVEGENFYGGKGQTPMISITYPTRQATDTDYMAFCRKQRVPIPPDWAAMGTTWVEQGTLTQNLLDPGAYADVWTYSDPVRRGACIALPRGNGQVGIICQSATTGNACFWDNKLRSDGPTAPPVDWRGGTRLIISQLQDGSNLQENCTDCHLGNNVFLMAPDDPTWVKVLTHLTSPGSTFTTQIDYSSDMQDGHPRYHPVTYPANRPKWVNAYQAGGCAGACHENPLLDFSTNLIDRPKMPPDCAAGQAVPDECYK
jgi:hypothetical protein